MKALDDRFVEKLDVNGAIAAELDTPPALLPHIRGVDVAAKNSSAYVRTLKALLRSGLQTQPAAVVDARKRGQGTRPLSILGTHEQVTYRALTDQVLSEVDALDRSVERYLEFIHAPVVYGLSFRSADSQGLMAQLYGDRVTHVVSSDITAFYQYIDHGILRRELLTVSTDYAAIDALIELLGEVQGRTYGLPQLYHSSDRLSEIYIDVLERRLLRSGMKVWRFNDDFRIACESYDEALHSVEQLAEGARELGLVLNENKTLTWKYWTYIAERTGLVAEEGQDTTQLDVEALVGEYSEITLDDPMEAQRLLRRVPLGAPVDNDLSLAGLTADQLRQLRRALRTLAEHPEPTLADRALRLVAFAPSLTPEVVGFLESALDVDPEGVSASVQEVLPRLTLGSWQSVWWTSFLESTELLRLLDVDASPVRTWAESTFRDSPHEGVSALAAVALARAGVLEAPEIEHRYRVSHPAWQPTWMAAFTALRQHDKDSLPDRVWKSLKKEPPPARWVLDDAD